MRGWHLWVIALDLVVVVVGDAAAVADIGPLSLLHSPQGPICGTTVQPSYLAHARLVGFLVWTVHGAFNVPYPRINPSMGMAIAMHIVTRIFVSPPRSHQAIVRCLVYAHKTHTKLPLNNLQWL
jgi:hypothetical protein